MLHSLQAVLDFHSQVGNVLSNVSDQYKELLGSGSLEDCSLENMMGALNVSGRYFTFKEQMKVSTTAHISGGWRKLAGTLKSFFEVAVALLSLFDHISVCVSGV